MHSLEQIKFMNTPAEIKRRQAIARRMNNASQKKKSAKTKSKKDACTIRSKHRTNIPFSLRLRAIAKCRKRGSGKK